MNNMAKSTKKLLLLLLLQLFYGPFPGPTRWADARRELLDFTVQGKFNTGRHRDHPDRCHSIRTNQWSPPPSTQTKTNHKFKENLDQQSTLRTASMCVCTAYHCAQLLYTTQHRTLLAILRKVSSGW